MPFWIGLALSSLTAYPIFRLLIKMNSRQKVSEFAPETHQAKQGTPTMGGLIFVIPFLIVAPILASLNLLGGRWFAVGGGPQGHIWQHVSPETIWQAPVLLFLLFAGIGFVDDFVVPRIWTGKRGLGWKQKLGLQFLGTLAFSLLAKHEGSQIAIDVIVILACANAYNFADGLDGLASSVGLLLIPGLMFVNSFGGRIQYIPMLATFAGAMLPFSYLNAPKAKVFMGDVGSLAFGSLIGASICIPTREWPDSWSFPVALGVLSLVLLAELLPVPLQILWVKLFKKRLFPFTPIHHAFEKAGWPETRVVALFAMLQLLCTLGCISVITPFVPGGWILPAK